MFELDAEQQAAVDRMVADTSTGALNASGLGSGKTAVTVEVAKGRKAQTILIVGPVSPKIKASWHSTFKQRGVDLPFREITTQTPENFEALRKGEPGIYYVGREYIGMETCPYQWAKLKKTDLAIAEESHFATNKKTKRWRALNRIKATYKIALSATPYGNKFTGMYAITKWLWPDIVDGSFYRWRDEWCKMVYDPFTHDNQKAIGERNPGAYVRSLPTYIYIPPPDVDVVKRKVYVELTPTQRKLYNQMEETLIAWVDDNPMVASIPIVKKTRLRQITLGVPVVDGETGDVDFEPGAASSKLDALERLIEKVHPDERMVIYLESERFVKVVLDRLGDKAEAWTGRVSKKKRAEVFDKFISGEIRYIVATVASFGEGNDGLQHVCNIEVWLQQSYNEVLNTQATGRLERRGQKKTIYRYYFNARDTDDDGQFSNLLQQRIDRNRSIRT